MSKIRRPRPITILYKGQAVTLKPENVGLKELKRVHSWLGRYLKYWKQSKRKKKIKKITPIYLEGVRTDYRMWEFSQGTRRYFREWGSPDITKQERKLISHFFFI